MPAHALVRCITPGCVAQLSKECMDLLNQIFVIDSSKRISLQGIKDHPWYNEPLSAQYAEGESKIREAQKEVEKYIASRRLSEACSLPPLATTAPPALCPRLLPAASLQLAAPGLWTAVSPLLPAVVCLLAGLYGDQLQA